VSEKHVPGIEFGTLQLAIWRKQSAVLRDGDRFFYVNDRLWRRSLRPTGSRTGTRSQSWSSWTPG